MFFDPRARKLNLIRYFPDWWSSLNPGRSPINDRRPWIAFEAIDYLDSILTADMLVFEFGSGGSTLFFSDRVRKVISAEHDKAWCEQVVRALEQSRVSNCDLTLYEPELCSGSSGGDAGDPASYLSASPQYDGMHFKAYASSIDRHSDESFDVVLIDGRSRPSCFSHAVRKLKVGGYLVLDNAERSYLAYIHNFAKEQEWEEINCFGLFPYISHLSQTCIWRK